MADQGRISVIVYDASGDTVGGPIPVLSVSVMEALDDIGGFEFEMPAGHPKVEHVLAGREVAVFLEGEGIIFRGLVVHKRTEVRD